MNGKTPIHNDSVITYITVSNIVVGESEIERDIYI